VHGVAPTTAVTGDHPRLIVGDNHHADPTIAARAAAMQTERNTMERYSAADRLQGALSHPGTSVPFVTVGQQVWFYRQKHGWLRGTVDCLKGKTVFLRHLGAGFVRGEGKIFSSHESRTKPFVARSHLPPAPPCPAPAPLGPIRTHTPAPPSAPTRAPGAAAYLIHPPDLSSHHHPRWNVAKRHEINFFDSFDCKTTIPAATVPPGEQIFDYLRRCDYKSDRGNGTPPTRARFCIASDREWNKANCSISLLPIGNWPEVASLTDQSPCVVGIGQWHALWGVTSALFIFYCLFACLSYLSAGTHYDRL